MILLAVCCETKNTVTLLQCLWYGSKMAVVWLHGQNGCFFCCCCCKFSTEPLPKISQNPTLLSKSDASLHHVLLRFRDVRVCVSQLLFLTGWVVLNAQYPISLANKLVCLKAESLSIFIFLPRFSIFPPYWAIGRQ